jgi:cyclopropane fatty-acyl-phospholipid synthase-like methyltransferase
MSTYSFLDSSKKLFEDTHTAMTVDNHKQHDVEPNYWEHIIKHVSKNAEYWQGKRALDFGCGCGRNIKNLLDHSNFDQVDGVDISSQNAEYAKRYALQHHPKAKVHTWENDGKTLDPCDNNTYDFIMSHQVIQHIGNYDIRLSLLKDMHRVLNTGGMICLHYMSMDGSTYYESGDSLKNMIVEDPNYIIKDLELIGFTEVEYVQSKDHYLKRDEYYFTAVK